MYKYSVVTAVYKSDKYINDFFKSISIQKFLPEEILLIDDTKNNLLKEKAIIFQKKFKVKVKIIRNKKNLGPCKSLNKGIGLAKNNLIFRLDVDDVWKKNHVNYYLKKYKKDKDCLIYCYSLKNDSIRNNLKCDNFLVNENQTIHSTWLINRNICTNFQYKLENPVIALEDYYTLSFYMRKGFNFYFENKVKTFKYNLNLQSHGNTHKNSPQNKIYRKKIAKLNLSYHYKRFIKKNQLNDRFLNFIKFIFIKFGLINYMIYLFWTMDYLNLKKILR